MSNRYDIPDEVIENLNETFKLIFDQEADFNRLAGMVHYWGAEYVESVLEYLYLKGVARTTNSKNNPMGYLFVCCRDFNDKKWRQRP